MKTVTVGTTALRTIIQKNRAEHRDIFLEAVEGFKDAMLKELEAATGKIRRGKLVGYINLPIPTDHTRDYDRVLKMLELHTEPTVQLDQESAAKYVMDDWEWKREFLRTSSSYSGKAKALEDEE